MKLLIVDDHTLFRNGLTHLLQCLNPAPTVVESKDLGTALQQVDEHDDLELILLDLNLEDTVGVDSLLNLRKHSPDIPIIVLSGEENPDVIRRCIDQGAMGFITKSATHDELLSAIQLILAGGVYLPRDTMINSALSRTPQEPSDVALLASLSARQREVLTYLLQGKPNKTISSKMAISENTVKAHLSGIFRALGARNRTEAVYFAARAGMPLK